MNTRMMGKKAVLPPSQNDSPTFFLVLLKLIILLPIWDLINVPNFTLENNQYPWPLIRFEIKDIMNFLIYIVREKEEEKLVQKIDIYQAIVKISCFWSHRSRKYVNHGFGLEKKVTVVQNLMLLLVISVSTRQILFSFFGPKKN